MSVERLGAGDTQERCDRCTRTTPHDVRVEIRTESKTGENAQFSREPYRIATCRDCGSESVLRMNDA